MTVPTTPADDPARPPYRPPDGLPLERQGRWGLPVAVLLHVVVLLLLLIPAVATGIIPLPVSTGAGGAGPAGGGGGGTGGLGLKALVPERLRFLHVMPQQPKPTAEEPVSPTVTPPPVERKEPETPPTPEPERTSQAEEPEATIASTGEGGGTGSDGSAGSGPGRGGGIGSGEGTGRGSGIGPGTGGGDDSIYPPSVTQVFLPPMPVPKKVSGHTLVAVFDVDSTGKVLDVSFNKTRDGEYNEKLEEVLHELRFRPGTRLDGRPVRASATITYSLY